MSENHFQSRFRAREKVTIGKGSDLVATVCAHLWRAGQCSCEVSWVHQGALHTQWVEEWRLEHAP